MGPTNDPIYSLPVSGAVGKYLRVILSAGVLALAGTTDLELGVTAAASFTADTVLATRLRNAQGVEVMTASVAITAGNSVYAGASGKVAATGTILIGTALDAATADGDHIRVIRTGTNSSTAIGVATGTSLAVTAGITSSGATGAGIGYATGAGGAVSQLTDRTTGVTLNTLSGAITTQATSLAAAAEVTFTVTNSTVAVGDVIVASIRSGPTAGVNTFVTVTAVAAGSFNLTLNNPHASTADTGAAIINFIVLKAVSA